MEFYQMDNFDYLDDDTDFPRITVCRKSDNERKVFATEDSWIDMRDLFMFNRQEY